MENRGAVNILLVDDREDNLVALSLVLRSPEYNLVSALSGEKALAELEARDFAVILMDVQMPGMDGLETARHVRLKERSRTTPIILVTGMYPDDEHIRLGYEVGAVDFLSKPFDPRVMKSKVAVFVDLFLKTEKIRQQEKLLHDAAESRFRTIFEQSPLAIQLYSPNGDSVEVNRAWELLWGRNEKNSPFSEAIQKAQGGEPSELPPVQYLGRWVEAFVYPVRNEREAIREVAVILKDVTDRKSAEEALRTSRDQLQIIFERVADGIIVKNQDGVCVYCNDIGAQMMGMQKAEEAIGKNIRDVMAEYDFADSDGNPLSLEQLPSARVLRGLYKSAEAVVCVRHRITKKETWIVVSARPVLNEAGMPHLSVTIYRNITEQRRSEENERFLSDATAILASSLDYHNTLTRVAELATAQLADSFGVFIADESGKLEALLLNSSDPAIQVKLEELKQDHPLHPDAPMGASKFFRVGKSAMLNDLGEGSLRSLIHVPIQVRDRSLGVISFFSMSDVRRYDLVDLALAEELGRRIGMVIDNSRLYSEAESQRERLQCAVQSRDEFISIASHELNTPITSLVLHAEMATLQLGRDEAALSDGELRERMHRFVSISSSQIDRLSRLIDEMLDVSRISNGKLLMEMETIELNRLVSGVLEEFSEQLRESGTVVSFGCGLDCLVRCDRFRIEQVVTNLLTNAMKYGVGKPISVEVRRDESYAMILVRDEGMGISREHHERIFNRFERAVSPTFVAGLGLGLYIVKKIVEAHGGVVSVESEPGAGACFKVALPLSASL